MVSTTRRPLTTFHCTLGALVLENHGPLGTLWVGLGLCAFYIALIWINTLLGVFLTPLFIIPATWAMDRLGIRKRPTTTPVGPVTT